MARIAYDEAAARAFAATRHVAPEGLGAWRAAVARWLRPRPGMRVLDLGAGTGAWAAAFTDWYGVEVVAVEPSAAMRARCGHPALIGGDAGAIPLRRACADAAWLSTVAHHLPDLPAAAGELRRVVRGGGPVLVRGAFAGGHGGVRLFEFFPEAVEVLDTYPSVADVCAAFGTAGFERVAVERVPQVSAGSLDEVAAQLRREAHSVLMLISDAAYAAGLARLRAAAVTATGPVVDELDLVVLR